MSFRDLFDQDKVKNMHADGVGESLHKLHKELGGVEQISKDLETDQVVSGCFSG